MNPYETDTSKIPSSDLYILDPLYGRYKPQACDLQPDRHLLCSKSSEAIAYRADIISRCTLETRIVPGSDGGRDVFAVGNIVVKSSHLQTESPIRDFHSVDENEIEAVERARSSLDRLGVQVPEIYFASKIEGRDVLIQSRIPGVALCVAWQYLTCAQKAAFKTQARHIIEELYKLPSPSCEPSYILTDHDPEIYRGIDRLEHQILFESSETLDNDIGFVHNDLNSGNIIVDNDRIVGLIDWEMAGYFNLQAVNDVHRRFRGPRREDFASLDLSEEKLADLLFWSDLYDVAR